MGKESFAEEDIFQFANQIGPSAGVTQSIGSHATLRAAAEAAVSGSRISERGRRLQRISSGLDVARKLAGALHGLLPRLESHVTERNRLAQQRETVDAAVLCGLYRAGIETIGRRVLREGRCPLCGQDVDTAALGQHLHEEVSRLTGVLQDWERIKSHGREIASSLMTARSAIDQLAEDTFRDLSPISSLSRVLQEGSRALDALHTNVVPVPEKPSQVSLPDGTMTSLSIMLEAIPQLCKLLEAERQQCLESEEDKCYYEAVLRLDKLDKGLERANSLQAQIAKYEGQVTSLGALHARLEAMEKQELGAVLRQISDTVAKYYGLVHPNEPISGVRLAPTEDRGVEFTVEFHDLDITPPRRTLSEAHLNTLGICLFLAAAQHFNHRNGFVVLDDVVTSFDSGHRRNLGRVLREHFSDMQILLMTHDQTWFEMLKREFANSNWAFMEALPWSFEDGVRLRESPRTLRDQIEQCLAQNDLQGAVSRTRQLMEMNLRQKCEDLGVRLEFRQGERNEQRTVNELMDGLQTYLRQNQSLRQKEAKQLFQDVKAGELINTLGVHHKVLGGAPLHSGDIHRTLKDLDAFETLFVCAKCGTSPVISLSPAHASLKQCKCGDLKI